MNFVFFIQAAVEAEAKLEEIRMLLASYQTFEPFSTYKRLDQPRTGGLKIENLSEFLADNQIQVDDKQLEYIFRFFDLDQDGIITFDDFKNVILPKMNDRAKDQALHHKGYDIPVGMLLPQEVEQQLAQFFLQLQKNYQQFQEIKEYIDLNQLDIYDEEKKISVKSLQIWLNTINQKISDKILESFIWIINGNQQDLYNLLDQIFQYEQQQAEQQIEQNYEQDQQQDQEPIESQENLELQAEDNIQVPENSQQEETYPQLDEQKQNNETYIEKQDPEEEEYLQKLEQIEIEILLEKQKIRRILRSFSQQQSKPIIEPIKESIFEEKSYRNSIYNKFNFDQPRQNNDFLRSRIFIDNEIAREEAKYKFLLESQINQSQIYSGNSSKNLGNSQLKFTTPSKNIYLNQLNQISGTKLNGQRKNIYHFNRYQNSNYNQKKY